MNGKTEKNTEHFYVHPDDVSEKELVFRKEESRHLTRVLRKKTGGVIFAVDGKGNRYEVRIAKRSGGLITADILSVQNRAGESGPDLTLAQGMIKGNRFDWLVEKAAEVGVNRIIPVRARHSVVKMLSAGKIARIQKIALAAMKQSGRSILPEIAPVQTLDRLFKTSADYDLRLIAHPRPDGQLVEWTVPSISCGIYKILCLVGPEGGFDEMEMAKAVDCGFHPVSLGPSRLRSETAGIAILIAAQMRFGGWPRFVD